MLDLSVIIPVYNTPQPALRRCFDSVKELQGIRWEALIIDDGSEQATGEFCREYCSENQDFFYFRKENGGVSSARNLGLDNTNGRYVMFLDADDMLLPDALLPEHFSQADLCIYDMQLHQNGTEQLWHSLDSQTVDREALLYQLLTGKSLNSPCVKLFRTEIIRQKQLRFDTAFVTGEDWMFVCDFVLALHSVLYVRRPCYRYFREESNGQSRTARFPDTIIRNHIDRFHRREQVIRQEAWRSCSAEQMRSMAAAELIEDLFNVAADLLTVKKLTRERKQLLRTATKEAGQLLCAPVARKTRVKLWVMSACPVALLPLAYLRMLYLKLKK